MAEKKTNGEAAPQPTPESKLPSKIDAVGEALAAMGDVSRSKIHDWVLEKYGYDMSLDHITDCKKTLAKRAGVKPPRKKPGPKPGFKRKQAAAGQEKITKKEAVRRSLATLGETATLKALKKDIYQRFGLTMTTNHISTTKGELRKKAARDAAAALAAPAVTQPEPAPVAAPVAAGNGKKSVDVDDLLALRGLVDRVGAEDLKKLIDVLAK
jgi:hypothetical protein